VEALEKILPALAQRYELVTVSELFSDSSRPA